MFEHGTSLFQGDAREPLHEVGDLGSILEVLEQSRDRYTGATKHPGTANAARVSFNSSAGAPVDHGLMLRRQPGSGKLKAANGFAERRAHRCLYLALYLSRERSSELLGASDVGGVLV
jgi:hypothetical protein